MTANSKAQAGEVVARAAISEATDGWLDCVQLTEAGQKLPPGEYQFYATPKPQGDASPLPRPALPEHVGLSMGPDDCPRLTLNEVEVAVFPAGTWGEVCDALNFGGYVAPNASPCPECQCVTGDVGPVSESDFVTTQVSGGGEECPNCESEHLTWEVSYTNKSDVADGRLRAHDVSCVFVLGCDECSETVKVKRAEDVAAALSTPQARPDGGGSDEFKAGFKSAFTYPADDTHSAPQADVALVDDAMARRVLNEWQQAMGGSMVNRYWSAEQVAAMQSALTAAQQEGE